MKQYNKKQFVNDVIAGLIVAIIALPLSIALAISSGVTPEKGLHTAIIGGFIIAFLGGSRVQIGGPSGTFMVIVYGIVATYGMDGLIIATIMAGIFMVCFGLLRLGSYIKFIPYPITTGFTSGIALVMFTSQMKDFLGLHIENSSPKFLEQWAAYFKHIDTLSLQTASIGFIALMILIFWPKVNKKIPGALIAIIVTSALVKFLNLEVETIGGRFGELSSSIPPFQVPKVDLEKIRILVGPALTIAALGSIESLLSAVVSDGMIGSKHRSNMELIADGTANIFSGFFGGIPVTGAIARTVANIKNGARTPISGMVHSFALLLIMLLFMPLAKIIP
ncbi:MAG: sodium-independent anion transporter, partial [Vallitaleaceae bacterium]|nr:sodium-independent anion transporter [Vallitaleaceae bacterium]